MVIGLGWAALALAGTAGGARRLFWIGLMIAFTAGIGERAGRLQTSIPQTSQYASLAAVIFGLGIGVALGLANFGMPTMHELILFADFMAAPDQEF
jgi:hypothetical protein